MEGLGRAEAERQAVHIGAGLAAFLLRFLGFGGSILLALAGLLFNLLLLPRLGGRRLWRRRDRESGVALGIVAYPASVLAMVLAFGSRLEAAAAGWGILAFGDGCATLAGRTFGRGPLPWNREKSWPGTIAHALCGSLAAWVLILWTAPGRYGVGFALAAATAAGVLAALVESLPSRVDDNLRAPPLAALLLFCLLPTEAGWAGLNGAALAGRAALGAVLNLLFAAAGAAAATLGAGGAVSAWLVGAVVFASQGWSGWALLLLFFVVGSGCTRLGYRRKELAGLAEGGGGRRGARGVLANGAVPAACALLAAVSPAGEIYRLAFVGSLAAAAADTAASEIGQAWGRRTLLITSLQPVPPGTHGGVSLPGTAAGAAAALLLAWAAAALGLVAPNRLLWVAAAGLGANLLESVLGATLERRGTLDNEEVNFSNALMGALAAAALVLIP